MSARYERRMKMTGSLQKKKLASGKEYYYIKLSYIEKGTGKRKSKTLGTGLEVKNNRRKAEAFKKECIEKYAFLENISECTLDTNILLCDYLDKWLEDKKIDLKTSTHEGYSYRVKRINDYFSPRQMKLIDLMPKDLDLFFKYCLQYGKINQKTKEKEPLSVRSVRSYKSILHAAFSQACIDGLVVSNPCIGVPVHGQKNTDYSEERLFLTEEEVSELLHFLAEYHPRLVPITFMGAYYGLRRSEILGLKWDSVDFKKRLIHIRHTVVKVKTVDASDKTKTKESRRSLNLFQTAENCLNSLKEEQERNRRYFKSEYKNSTGYIFTWEDGRCYNPDYITRAFSKATKAFGRPEITLHKLRHTCCSILINKGWDLKQLQYWLGHEDAQTTLNIYSHYNKQRLNSCENDLSEISMMASDLFTQRNVG